MSDTLSIAPETDTPVEQRLQETAAVCLSSLEAWKKDLKDEDAREKLLEAVHELRKVCARLEVDIAMSDRKNINAKHIPIPEHKSKTEKRKDQKPLSEILPVAEIKKANERKKIEIEEANDAGDDADDDVVNEDNGADEKPKQRRPRRKKKEDDEG
jgi:hypothetical protein